EQSAFLWVLDNNKKSYEAWVANNGQILKLPAAEQETMMKNFVALGTKIVDANAGVKKEFEKLKAVVDAKAPKESISAHPRVSGDPESSGLWVPTFAGTNVSG